MNLITIQDARFHLRIDDPDSSGEGGDDGWLEIFIPIVSDAIFSWLKDSWRAFVPSVDSNGDVVLDSAGDPIPSTDSAGDPIVRPAVRGAALVELASQYRFREGEGGNQVAENAGYGYILSKGATALLAGLRKSTVR